MRFSDQLQLRLSATQTRTRPSFDQLRPILTGPLPPCFGVTPRPANCFVGGSGGNPLLEQMKSDNYDASLEYYFAPNGYASLAVFRRELDGFITTREDRIDHPVLGPDTIQGFFPVNAGKGSIQGFELSAQTFFDFLPGIFSGFGAQGNLTHLDDEMAFTDITLQAGEAGRITGVSRWSYNLTGMYERGPITARLSYNWRSKWNTAYVIGNNGFTGEYTAAVDRLDFSTSYTPFEKITLTFDWTNILGSPFRNFRRFTPAGDVFPRDVRFEETIYSFGIRARM